MTRRDICLIGHSHVPLAYSPGRGGRANGGYSEPGTRALDGDRWLLNPGSVGQPRDSDPRAAYMVLDLDAATATWRRVDYDIERDAARDHRRGAAREPRVAAGRGQVAYPCGVRRCACYRAARGRSPAAAARRPRVSRAL